MRGSTHSTFEDELAKRLERAIAGDAGPLYDLLARASGLPGVRVNVHTVDNFARACAARGAGADPLVAVMARLDTYEAAGATDREILPVCAVAALGARGAKDVSTVEHALAVLHVCADDTRFRVREAVPEALARLGGACGDGLVAKLDGWMGGYFQAAAVLTALATPSWLDTLKDCDGALARLDQAWTLACEAPRSAARYPGFKSLLEALASSPARMARKFRTPVFDALVRWARVEEPALRDAIAANLRGPKIAGHFAAEAERVRRALEASAPIPRDPTLKVQGTRQRGARGRNR
ncbi:MAG: hypothetical protein EXR75_15610 [Myxococcales bacterium]|nr:hypothetical protein [Myxococcales bacterium]